MKREIQTEVDFETDPKQFENDELFLFLMKRECDEADAIKFVQSLKPSLREALLQSKSFSRSATGKQKDFFRKLTIERGLYDFYADVAEKLNIEQIGILIDVVKGLPKKYEFYHGVVREYQPIKRFLIDKIKLVLTGCGCFVLLIVLVGLLAFIKTKFA